MWLVTCASLSVARPGLQGGMMKYQHRISAGQIQCCANSEMDNLVLGEGFELPLFDPLQDEIPFPFAAPEPANAVEDEPDVAEPSFYRYAFDRPAHLRMLSDTWPTDSDTTLVFSSDAEPALFGHCVKAGDGEVANPLMLGSNSLVRVGTVGVALRLADVQRSEQGGGGGGFNVAAADGGFRGGGGLGAFGGPEASGEVAVAVGIGAFRFVVDEVTQTIPYPVASVRPLRDEEPVDPEATAGLEADVMEAIRQLVELSRKLEDRGLAAEAAAAALAGPMALLSAHDQAVRGGAYASQAERWECFSLAACEVINMPYGDACEALSTTSGHRRLELLRESLAPAVQEMATLSSLEGLRDSLGDGLDGGGNAMGLGGLPPDLGGLAAAAAAAAAQSGNRGGIGATGAAAGANARPSAFGGTTAFSPIDIPVGNSDAAEAKGADGGPNMPSGPSPDDQAKLDEGARLEYWWDPTLGWIGATVKRRVRGSAGEVLHTLEFDMDGTWEDVPLYFGDGKPRWRPERRQG